MQISIEQTVATIARSGVVAIIRVADLDRAVELASALLAGGITALEFTLTNPQAIATIREVKLRLPQFAKGQAVIGAGSVLTPQEAEACISAGSQFIVSPNTNFAVIERCKQHEVAVMPGALTPTEIMQAWNAGATVIKIFPARTFGAAYLKDVLEPLPFLKLMPTGGVNPQNAGEFIRNGALAIGAGGNLVDKKLVAVGDWASITAKAEAYVQAVQAAREG